MVNELDAYRLNLIQQYPHIPAEILNQYKPEDEYLWVNTGDKNLEPIRITLPPEPKDLTKIDGFGLPAPLQKFAVQKIPSTLVQLAKQFEDDQDRIWAKLDQDRDYYKEEIAWIDLMWHYRLNGYWCYINGKLTYMDGWHFMYCNFWKFEDNQALPEYRAVNRKWFIAVRYFFTTTETFAEWEYDAKGKPVKPKKNAEGHYDMVDLGIRVCVGVVFPKGRQWGATNMALCCMYCEITIRFGVEGGIMSMTGGAAKDHFSKILVPGWRNMPFFFKPRYDGNYDPKTTIDFTLSKGASAEDHLTSSMHYSDTAQSTGYDRFKLFFSLLDEQGKTVEVNVVERWQQIRLCHARGNDITGFSIQPSTVGEMTQKGGANFYELASDSHFQDRNENGQTKSGLFNLYFPSTEGLQGFIDEYGESVIEDPARPVKNNRGKTISAGAKTYLNRQRAEYLHANTPKSLEKYRELVRLYPMEFAECFRSQGGEVGFDYEVIDRRMDELRFSRTDLERIGNLKRIGGHMGAGKILFEDDPDGRFVFTRFFPQLQNQKTLKDGTWWPRYPTKFTACGDAFKFNKTEHNRMSKGAGSVLWNRDFSIDPEEKDIRDWESYNFICHYLYRPEGKDEYCEDMLMMCEYVGAMMYPEMNVPVIADWFLKRNYGGYLKYDIDENTGKLKVNPGFTAAGVGNKAQQKLMHAWRDFIKYRGHKMNHMEMLKQAREIPGIEKLTDFDLMVSGGGALIGAEGNYDEYMEEAAQEMNLSLTLEEYEY